MPTLPKQPMKKNYEEATNALDQKLAEYLEKEGISSLDLNVTEEQLEKLFFVFTKDFLEYQIFFDEYSTLCEKLMIVLRDIPKSNYSCLYSICVYGAELNWYIRNEPSRAAEFLQTILDFYKKNTQSL